METLRSLAELPQPHVHHRDRRRSNCPGRVLLYRHGLKSYRDLPIRMGEFGKVHRYEPSGTLHGLLRVRHFTQDDAHIYCTPQLNG